jgi:hypothetical protein
MLFSQTEQEIIAFCMVKCVLSVFYRLLQVTSVAFDIVFKESNKYGRSRL